MVALDHALVVRLRPEAARRDVPVARLIHDLLDTIARDGLTAAALDADSVPDEGDLPGAAARASADNARRDPGAWEPCRSATCRRRAEAPRNCRATPSNGDVLRQTVWKLMDFLRKFRTDPRPSYPGRHAGGAVRRTGNANRHAS